MTKPVTFGKLPTNGKIVRPNDLKSAPNKPEIKPNLKFHPAQSEIVQNDEEEKEIDPRSLQNHSKLPKNGK
jgi:hypothetical protein